MKIFKDIFGELIIKFKTKKFNYLVYCSFSVMLITLTAMLTDNVSRSTYATFFPLVSIMIGSFYSYLNAQRINE